MTPENVIGYFDTLSIWGRWGDDERLGTLNLITPEVHSRAASQVRTGEVVSLSRDIDPENADPLGSGIAVVQRFRGVGEVSHHNRWTFFFVMLPWRMKGVTSSATNPIAMF